MIPAIQSGLQGRAEQMLSELLQSPKTLGQGRAMVEPLCAEMAARHDADELSAAVVQIAGLSDAKLQASCLRGMRSGFRSPRAVTATEAARVGFKQLAASKNGTVKSQAIALMAAMKLESASAPRSDRGHDESST